MTEKQNPPAEGHAFQDEVTELEAKSATAARLFDIRRIIGALFVVYGLIVGAAGLFATDADLEKAQDININLWTGLGMLALGLFFVIWVRLRPTVPPTPPLPQEAAGAAGPETGPTGRD
ncbi:hypothetical protein [Streptomyces sp. BBFR102]|uniref:hypothetical protein n=1 Tax=Streptomyces sp. BBFR102 TaxID=3448171 RepID=UPI003F52E691